MIFRRYILDISILPLSDQAPVVIGAADRVRWITVGEDVVDLIGPESADHFHIAPVTDAAIAAEVAL